MARKIIIDTDPGVDDAMAILFAFRAAQLDVLGLTTTFGNVSVERATQNALTLTEIAGVTVPVAQGVAAPSQIDARPYPDFVHGEDGFGNIHWPAPKCQAIEKSAAQFIVDTVRQFPGEVTIVALGPLGNLAESLALDPELANLVDEVVLMGGAATECGNVSPVAEANVISDPHAADAVKGLDVTHQILLNNARLARIKEANPIEGGFLYQSAQHYINFYSRRFDMEGCYFHDASTIAYVIDSSIFGIELGAVRVACEGIGIGQTIVAPQGLEFSEPHWNDVPMTQVCMEVDSERLLALFEKTLS